MNRREAVKAMVTTIATAAAANLETTETKAASMPADAVKPVAPGRVQPFPLTDVGLLEGPFHAAMDRDREYLLFLEPDRFLHNFRVNAGLPPKGKIYGGWEAEGVAGQTLGHYLSACSMMYQSTGDARLRDRVATIVGELALCQAQDPTGYVSAIPGGKAIFAAVAAGDGGAISRGWVPWYTTHKVMAGLRDACQLAGIEAARPVLVRLADWTDATTRGLSDEEDQKMLDTEHGGMNEVLADVYAMTGDPKYLTVAGRFYHRRVLIPLTERRDALDGFHSNTQIPKVIGLARLYELTGDPKNAAAASFFWETVVGTRSYVLGGNGDYEHFFPVLEFGRHLDSSATAETCCTYNMLKLTRHLFQQDPQAKYADYYERALYNQILASQEPEKGMMTYFSPMRPGHFKVYSSPTDSFWCCVGTGIENHAKYGDSIYFHDDRALWVNLFIASELTWAEKGLTVRQETSFPAEGKTRLSLRSMAGKKIESALAIKLRYPGWADGMSVAVNGKPIGGLDDKGAGPGSYITLNHAWKDGDVIDVILPMRLRTEPLPHAAEHVALLYGPIVLAGDMGVEGLDKLTQFTGSHEENKYAHLPALHDIPVWVSDDPTKIVDRIQPVTGQPLRFRTEGLGQPGDVTLLPYYETHHRRYNLYWSVYTPVQWHDKQAEVRAVEAAQRALDARTVDSFRPGEQQSEVDHHLQSAESHTGSLGDRKWRDAGSGGYFSFVLAVASDGQMDLACTYWGSDSGSRTFDISVDGVCVATQTLNADHPNNFWERVYPLPGSLTKGKREITVRFDASSGNIAGGLFGCATRKTL